ncbi:MAG: glycosyltransferase family 2 protein, partial [Candidatus Thorarchaeota archaeon]
MKEPLISIIVLTWNGKQYLKNCLDSCFSQTYKRIELIVVDNGSTDSTVDYVKKNYPKVHLIVNKKNLGFAEGNN